jgi:hypothetical protein
MECLAPTFALPARVDIAVTLIAECRRSQGRDLSPSLWGYAKIRRRLLRRDVGGAIRPSCAGGRRLEGERDGSRSRRPAVTASARSASNGAEPEAAERHMADRNHGVRPAGSDPYGRPQLHSGTQIAVTRVPKGNPRAVRPWSPQGLPRRFHAGPPGAVSAPRLPSWHPRTRRTPGPSPWDGRRVRQAGPRKCQRPIGPLSRVLHDCDLSRDKFINVC